MGDLLSDLRELPQQSATRRVNELVKRARLLKAHCYLLDHLREQMPTVYGSRMKKGKMMQELEAALNNAIPALMEFLPRGAASVEESVTESVGVSEVETVI